MSYRPITDTWILARAKLKGGRKYYGNYTGDLFDASDSVEQPRTGETGNLLQLSDGTNGDITDADYAVRDDAPKPPKRGKRTSEPEHELERDNDRYDAVMRHLRSYRKRDKGVTAGTLALAVLSGRDKASKARAETWLTWLVAKGFLVANETPGKYTVTDLA